ncbi:hypothetical protein NOS3756_31610 [Nostoc sp. NIES-3756]|uniref:hypothetical protein n=1 Tax=Nostoc sp. NIES-3756 TaxID=1751286 RepID=UPI000720B2F8|nr:hypothetical protein [Nostoc sp. NIES-3756]BAT54195.1 hypothetical protein NOS3756_31610 [Nostoc sp. NIES-3756]
MSNQQVAKQLFLNTEVWEELTDSQGEVITGGVADAGTIIARNLNQIFTTLTEKNKNFDPTNFTGIVDNLIDKNPNI